MDYFLLPVLALVGWTLVVLAFGMTARIKNVMSLTSDPQDVIRDPSIADKLPRYVKQISSNYTNLTEQPVLFYVLMFYLFLTGSTSDWLLFAAWLYVAIRVVHSFVQTFMNHLLTRLSAFLASSFVLIAMYVGTIAGL